MGAENPTTNEDWLIRMRDAEALATTEGEGLSSDHVDDWEKALDELDRLDISEAERKQVRNSRIRFRTLSAGKTR